MQRLAPRQPARHGFPRGGQAHVVAVAGRACGPLRPGLPNREAVGTAQTWVDAGGEGAIMPRGVGTETGQTPRLPILSWSVCCRHAEPPQLARFLVAELGWPVKTRHSGMAGYRSTRRVSKFAPRRMPRRALLRHPPERRPWQQVTALTQSAVRRLPACEGLALITPRDGQPKWGSPRCPRAPRAARHP